MPDARKTAGYKALCCQVVTLYHANPGAKTITRTVLKNCFLDKRRRATQSATGTAEAGAFVLIVPPEAGRFGADYALAPQDRVMDGEGPEIGYDEWAEFSPAAVAGLCAVQYVDPKYRRGAFDHLEAGGWWTKGGSGAHSLTN